MAQITPLFKIVVLAAGLWLAAGSVSIAQTIPPCSTVAHKGNAYDNCTGDTCERMVCNGTAFVPIEIWNNAGKKSLDIAFDTSICNADRRGRLTYNGQADVLCYCSGTAWKKFSGTGAEANCACSGPCCGQPDGTTLSYSGGSDWCSQAPGTCAAQCSFYTRCYNQVARSCIGDNDFNAGYRVANAGNGNGCSPVPPSPPSTSWQNMSYAEPTFSIGGICR